LIRIGEDQDLTLGHLGTLIPKGTNGELRTDQYPVGMELGYSTSLVGRSVVDDNQLKRNPLASKCFDASSEPLRVVQNGNDDRWRARFNHSYSSPLCTTSTKVLRRKA
jgi:hypothetical protein